MEYLLGNLEAKLLEKEEIPSDELIFLINSRIKPPVEVRKDDVFIRAMFLVSDQVNSYGGCFPSDEHGNLARLLIDSPVLVGHTKDKLPIARNFKAEIVKKDEANWIKVWFYWLKESAGSLSLKENIDHGIYKECSIGFTFELPECSICSEDMRRCQHIPFKSYPGPDDQLMQAHFNYRKISKVLETSLVYRGALPNTSITNDLIYQKHDCQNGICKLGRVYRDVVEGALRKAGLDNGVELAGDISEKGYSDHHIDLICRPDLEEKVLGCLPENYRGKVNFIKASEGERVKVSLFNFIPPTKPEKTESFCNEFFDPQDFSFLAGDWIVEPKYDGVRAQVHKKGEEIRILTELGETVESQFPTLTKSVLSFPHQDLILDGELVRYKGKSRLKYGDVASHIQNDNGVSDDFNFKYKVFDILYLNGTDLTSESLKKRKEILEENIKDSDSIQKVKFEKLSSDSLVKKIKELSTTEGAMLKGADSSYFDSSRWYKWKKELELDVLVTEAVHNKGGSYNYVCAVGSRLNPLPLGTTYSTKVKAKSGDVIRVKVDSLGKNENGYSWYAPQVKDVRGDKKEPDPLLVLKRMTKSVDTIHKTEILNSKEKNRFVLQVYLEDQNKHYLLKFLKNEVTTGLMIFKFDLKELNRGKRFLCEFKNQHTPKWFHSQAGISPGKEDKVCSKEEFATQIKILDSGHYETLREETNFTSLKMSGKILNGIYLIKKVIINKNEKWLMWKRSRELRVKSEELRVKKAVHMKTDELVNNLKTHIESLNDEKIELLDFDSLREDLNNAAGFLLNLDQKGRLCDKLLDSIRSEIKRMSLAVSRAKGDASSLSLTERLLNSEGLNYEDLALLKQQVEAEFDRTFPGKPIHKIMEKGNSCDFKVGDFKTGER